MGRQLEQPQGLDAFFSQRRLIMVGTADGTFSVQNYLGGFAW